jgi:hypothetical protein
MPVHEACRGRGDGWRKLESAGEPVGTWRAPAGNRCRRRPALIALASTVTSATALAAELPQPMARASIARRRGAPPGAGVPCIGRGHRPRATARTVGHWSMSNGPECQWHGRREARRHGVARAGSGRVHRPWAPRAGAGTSRPLRVPGRRMVEAPVLACWWPRGGAGAGKWGAAGGTAAGTMVRWRGYGAGGASAGAWGAGDSPSTWAPGRRMCLLTCMNGAETGLNRGILSRDLPPLCAERTRLNRRRQMAT